MQEDGGREARLQHAARSVPLGTQALVAVNCIAFVVQQVGGVPLTSLSLAPLQIVGEWEVYRLVSSAFTHEGFFHLAFNMLSLVAWGSTVEKTCGSTRFLFLNLVAVLLGSCLYVAVTYAVAAVLGPFSLMGGAVGYSGVLFTLAVVESHVATSGPTRSVCGIFEVPSRAYPFALLFLLALVPGCVLGVGYWYCCSCLSLPALARTCDAFAATPSDSPKSFGQLTLDSLIPSSLPQRLIPCAPVWPSRWHAVCPRALAMGVAISVSRPSVGAGRELRARARRAVAGFCVDTLGWRTGWQRVSSGPSSSACIARVLRLLEAQSLYCPCTWWRRSRGTKRRRWKRRAGHGFCLVGAAFAA